MSRTAYNPDDSYTGDGSTSEYAFTFKIESLDQLLVIVMDGNDEIQRVRGSDTSFLSTVDFDPVDGGGTVTLQANLTSGYEIFLLLANDEPTQDFLFRNKGSFTLRRFELALDKVLGPIQRLVYRMNRTVRGHETEDVSGFNFEIPRGITSQANKLLGINSDGNGFSFTDPVDLAAVQAGVFPAGGDTGAALVKASGATGDVQWDTFAFTGFSARFSEGFTSDNLRDTLEKILDLSYVPPSVSFAATGSGTVREKGDTVNGSTLTATVTKTTDDIARIQFFLDGVSIDDNNPPANTGSGNTSYVDATIFSDNVTYRVDVTDDGTSGGPTTVSASRTFNFVYPYYSGAGVPSLTAAQVAALTKDIRTSTASLNKNFTTSNGDVYYFAYPASYGALTSILDENGFETIGDWTLRTENITGLDATAQSYRIYEFNNPVVAGTTNYTFLR